MASFTPTPEMIDAVAEWHQRQSEDRVRRPLVPALKQRFNLDNLQAVAVIQAANKGGANHAS
ncbi:hypothetical protein ASD50_18345 [Mesorhizobium sp. Root552]|uniref:hypothetical protein n=1 Tax=Mesorhizobium sp. Root552 TaxID=1736555 RepID=UPI0006FDBB44|nr:hypothetical protein [Mesorhizobium sp. Root552]KQZ29152.1 hypothetical protein ASD50_18345 [Mesorhizobium sp. Root552]